MQYQSIETLSKVASTQDGKNAITYEQSETTMKLPGNNSSRVSPLGKLEMKSDASPSKVINSPESK